MNVKKTEGQIDKVVGENGGGLFRGLGVSSILLVRWGVKKVVDFSLKNKNCYVCGT